MCQSRGKESKANDRDPVVWSEQQCLLQTSTKFSLPNSYKEVHVCNPSILENKEGESCVKTTSKTTDKQTNRFL